MRKAFIVFLVVVATGAYLYALTGGEVQTSGQEVYTLKVLDQQLSREQAVAIARALGIEGIPAVEGKAWVFRDATVYKYGAVRYLNSTLAFDTRNLPEEIPSEAEAKAVALKYVQKLADMGILEQSLLSPKLEVVKDEEVVAYRNGTRQRYVLNVHVNVPLEYNGIPLHGAGAKVRVYLSGDGKLAGVLSFPGKLIPDRKISIISETEAVEKLRSMGYENAEIDSVQLVYEVPPPESMPASITPAYLIKGRLTLSDGSVVRFARVIPAARG
jgi:hypothetical protein